MCWLLFLDRTQKSLINDYYLIIWLGFFFCGFLISRVGKFFASSSFLLKTFQMLIPSKHIWMFLLFSKTPTKTPQTFSFFLSGDFSQLISTHLRFWIISFPISFSSHSSYHNLCRCLTSGSNPVIRFCTWCIILLFVLDIIFLIIQILDITKINAKLRLVS